MGQFKVEVIAVGGHGCQREFGDGTIVHGCELPGCPDCAARHFVDELRRQGQNVESATLTHWPGQPNQVVDNLVSRVRKGKF